MKKELVFDECEEITKLFKRMIGALNTIVDHYQQACQGRFIGNEKLGLQNIKGLRDELKTLLTKPEEGKLTLDLYENYQLRFSAIHKNIYREEGFIKKDRFD